MGGGCKVDTMGRGAQEKGPAGIKTHAVKKKISKNIISLDDT